MLKKEQSFIIDATDKESILEICLNSFKQLGWPALYAGENNIIGSTPKTWKTNSQDIIITAQDNLLVVISQMTKGEMLDAAGRNKKNIDAFFCAFEIEKTATRNIATDKITLQELREATKIQVAKEAEEAEKVSQAMNLKGSNLYATYTIIGINVLIFILMALNGAGIVQPNGLLHIKWGSNFGPLTLSGDWWRLITNMFIHFGIIHLLMNMYTFFMAGVYLEPMLGKPRFLLAYFCTGILASITSLYWHQTPTNSAGASGAIFGMYGLFFAFLTTNLIPNSVRKSLLQSIGIFIVYNLAFGMKSGIDNSAHIGGLLSGFAIGYLFYYGIKKEKQGQTAMWPIPLVLFLTVGGMFLYLQTHHGSQKLRDSVLVEIKSAGFKDNEKFQDAIKRFSGIEFRAMQPMQDTTITEQKRASQIKDVSIPEWEKGETLANEMQSYTVSDELKQKAAILQEYVSLRKQECSIMVETINNHTEIPTSLNEVRVKIRKLIEKLDN